MADTVQRLSIKEKVGYALGDTASNLFWQTFMMFLLYFYTDIFGITPAAAGTLFLVSRIWDTTNDPIMGLIADRTSTRWGKFRPWLLWMAVPMGVVAVLNFTTPDLSPGWKLFYAYVTYNLLMMAYTAINVPYSALMGVMTADSTERTSLSSYRFVCAFVGGLIIQGATISLVTHFGKDNQTIVAASLADGVLDIKEVGTGAARISVTADDGKGGSTENDFLIKIHKPGFSPPQAAKPLGDLDLDMGFESREIDLSGFFSDPDEDRIRYSAVTDKRSVVEAAVKGDKLVLTEAGTGTTAVTVIADDRKDGTGFAKLNVRVKSPGNVPPGVSSPPADVALNAGFGSHSIDISGIFQDTETLQYSVGGFNSSVISASIADGKLNIWQRTTGKTDLVNMVARLLRIRPTEIATGRTPITVVADDARGGSASVTFNVTVKGPANSAPSAASPVTSITVLKGFGSRQIDLAGRFEDIDGDKLSYSVGVIDEARGFQLAMGSFAMLAVVLFLITFASTRERIHPPAGQKSTLKTDLADLMQNKPWILLLFVGIFTLTFVSIRNGSIVYYFKYYVGSTALAAGFMLTGTIVQIVSVMLTGPMARRVGNRQLYIICMGGASILMVLFYFLKAQNVALMFGLQILICLFLGPTSPLVWAMYADTADYSEWRTGRRATGLVFSAASSSQKLGWTIGGALAGYLLGWFGFQANADQAPDTLTGIRLLMSFIPAIASGLATILMFFYTLDESKMSHIAAELAERKKSNPAES